MASYRDERVAPNRLAALATSLFALTALVLAFVGLYGVIGYAVEARHHEIGVRLAVGAARREIVGLVMTRAMALVAVGMALGIAGALAGAGALSGLVYGIEPRDPGAFGVAAATALVAGLTAAWRPARRAARVDPVHLLRPLR